MDLSTLPATSLRVERSTPPAVNERIRSLTDAEILRLEAADDQELAARLVELDHEWDVERLLQVNASVLVLLGLALGATRDRRFLVLPAAVFSFFAQHALQGWCPPIPMFRRLGVRTQREIARERFAIKALRGDFDGVTKADAPASHRVRDILKAVDT